MLKFVDFHCDTITTALEQNQSLYENSLHIDIKRMLKFKSSVQFFAVWLKKEYYKDAFLFTKKAIKFFEEELEKNCKFIKKTTHFNQILENEKNGLISAILSIEGAESLEGKVENLNYFYEKGLKMLTLCWNYENQVGYGIKSNLNFGLKPFGKILIKEMNDLNIIIDVSHLNEKGFLDVVNISKKPFIASHSNAFTVSKNERNLKDWQIKSIKEIGGLIGINIYPYFLNGTKNATVDDVFKHIDYIIHLIGDENISLGADFDGIDITPINLEEISRYEHLFNEISNEFGRDFAEKIFYKNAYNFFKKNF